MHPGGPSAEHPDAPHRVAVLLYHHANELEVAGALGAVQAVRRELEDPEGLEAVTVARRRHSVQTSGGLIVTPTWGFPGAPRLDALLVPGGPGVERALRDEPTLAWLRSRAADVGRLACSGSGALLLGAAGLLRDQDVAAHPELRTRLADYEVGNASPERLLLPERGVWSAAVGSAALELGLALAGRAAPEEAVRRAAAGLGLGPA